MDSEDVWKRLKYKFGFIKSSDLNNKESPTILDFAEKSNMHKNWAKSKLTPTPNLEQNSKSEHLMQ